MGGAAESLQRDLCAGVLADSNLIIGLSILVKGHVSTSSCTMSWSIS